MRNARKYSGFADIAGVACILAEHFLLSAASLRPDIRLRQIQSRRSKLITQLAHAILDRLAYLGMRGCEDGCRLVSIQMQTDLEWPQVGGVDFDSGSLLVIFCHPDQLGAKFFLPAAVMDR